jgi:tetratricopeptide (TPR) repeat protein
MDPQFEAAQIGDLIGGRYEILGTLGKGGFGIVYHARARGKEFALKTYLNPALDRRSLARFRQESEIWIALGSHPYVVQALFADDIDGRLYVGLELIRPAPGAPPDLEHVIRSGGAPLDQILLWAIQWCHGMEYAALRGIRAHRDLKPANILLNEAGDVKINDFGLATQPLGLDHLDLTEDSRRFQGQTWQGIGFGTPTHMPPEQFVDAASCDARSDIYAAGVVLHQLVHGELPVSLPWPADASLENRMRYWKDMEAAHRAHVFQSSNHPLDGVLNQCLAPDRTSRYPDFQALRQDLETILRARGREAVAPPMVRPLSKKSWLARGHSLARIGRHAQAIHAFNQALQDDAMLQPALFGKANALLAIGRPHLAQPLFDALLQREPGFGLATAGKAKCLQARGYPNEALQLFDQAVQAGCKEATVWASRGRLLRSMGDSEGAQNSFDRALELAPTDADVLTENAFHTFSLWKYGAAQDQFERALKRQPLHPGAALGRAACLLVGNAFEESLSVLRSLESNHELGPRGRLFLAEALSRNGQVHQALALADRSGAGRAETERIRMRVQWLVDNLRVCDALDAWTEAYPDVPTEETARTQGIVLQVLAGLEDKALRSAAEWLGHTPGHEAICAAACGAALRRGQDEYALQVCDHGLSFHPESDVLQYDRAIALAALRHEKLSGEAFVELSRRAQAHPLVRTWAGANAAALRGIPVVAPAPSAARFSLPNVLLLSDAYRPMRPSATLQLQANEWHPAFRLPHLRPVLYLFPRLLPMLPED